MIFLAQRLILPSCLLGALLFCGSFVAWAADGKAGAAAQQRPAFSRATITIDSQDGSRQKLRVEVARKPNEQAYGLMKVKQLPDTDGMLFVMAESRPQLFWMKDTLIPLDMLFLDERGHISHIVANAQPLALDHISSRGNAKGVLEIAGGMAERWGIKAGDSVVYKDFQ